jgi:hypothetical protein
VMLSSLQYAAVLLLLQPRHHSLRVSKDATGKSQAQRRHCRLFFLLVIIHASLVFVDRFIPIPNLVSIHSHS